MDAQHRHILDLVVEVARAQASESDSAITEALKDLRRYAEWHLEREELVLRIRHYPGYAEHKAEHDIYRRKIAGLEALMGRRDLPNRVMNFVSEWWTSHICGSDQKYARYFQAKAAEEVSELAGVEG